MTTKDYRSFYSSRREKTYGEAHSNRTAEQHGCFEVIRSLVHDYKLANRKCLEIGSGGGMFQDLVEDYYGTDISESVAKRYHKPYRICTGEEYPFENESFDAIWTITVYEHIPHLQKAMLEIKRLLRPGGICLFMPAWQCRSWAANGYNVRPYSDFGLAGKLIKASIPLRDSIVWRSFCLFPKRIIRHLQFKFGKRYHQIHYKKIKANYETYWVSDSDACNHIDPHDAILWFESNGFRCLSHPMHMKALMVRSGPVVVQKRGSLRPIYVGESESQTNVITKLR